MSVHHSDSGSDGGQFVRRYRRNAAEIAFTLNGELCHGRSGDTVLTAILTLDSRLRQTEFTGENRAGFCLIGACQDCVVMTDKGERLRACTTPLEAGMAFITRTASAGLQETGHD